MDGVTIAKLLVVMATVQVQQQFQMHLLRGDDVETAYQSAVLTARLLTSALPDDRRSEVLAGMLDALDEWRDLARGQERPLDDRDAT